MARSNIILRFLLWGIFLLPVCVFGHIENEASYIISDRSMTVHLTPQTVYDILSGEGIASSHDEVIDFGDHLDFLEKYFNDCLDLKINGSVVSFQLESADLEGHDAEIRFALDNLPVTPREFSVHINCITGIYNRPSNFVKWISGGQEHTCMLTKSNRECDWQAAPPKQDPRGNFNAIMGMALLLTVPLVLFFFLRKKPG